MAWSRKLVARMMFIVLFPWVSLAAQGLTEVQQYLVKGNLALKNHDYPAAIDHYRDARRVAPRNAEASYGLALAYKGAGQPEQLEEAVRYFEEAAKLGPGQYRDKVEQDLGPIRQGLFEGLMARAEGELKAGGHEKARDAATRAHDSAVAASWQLRARTLYYKAAAEGIVGEALSKLKKPAVKAVLIRVKELNNDEPIAALVKLLDEQLRAALRARSVTVLAPESKEEDVDVVLVRRVGQLIEVECEEGRGGQPLADRTLNTFGLVTQKRAELSPDPISLDLAIQIERPQAQGAPRQWFLGERDELRQGDEIRLSAKSDREAHVYIFLFDSQGEVTRFYPDTEDLYPELRAQGFESRNPVAKDGKILIPPVGSLTLDDQPGLETFYIVASLEPLPNIDAIAARLKRVGDEGRAGKELSEALQNLSWRTRHQVGAEHLEILRGRGAVVRFKTFKHVKKGGE